MAALLADYLLKLSFESVVSGDQEYGYPLLPALSGGILKTFAASELLRIWQIASSRCDAEFGRHREHSRQRSKSGDFRQRMVADLAGGAYGGLGGSDGGCIDCGRGAWWADGGVGFDAAGPSGAAVRAGFPVAGGRGRGETRSERNAGADCTGAGSGHETSRLRRDRQGNAAGKHRAELADVRSGGDLGRTFRCALLDGPSGGFSSGLARCGAGGCAGCNSGGEWVCRVRAV